MATYKEISNWIKQKYSFTPKNCWIAHCKELYGLPHKASPRRYSEQRVYPCPEDKREIIKEAFEDLGML